MAWIGLPADKLCAMIKDRGSNGDRDFAALIKHVSDDKLVLWGWNPGEGRAPVPVPHDIFVTQFKLGRGWRAYPVSMADPAVWYQGVKAGWDDSKVHIRHWSKSC